MESDTSSFEGSEKVSNFGNNKTTTFEEEKERERSEMRDREPVIDSHRRRISGIGNKSLSRQSSFRKDFEHAAAETYLITGLSFKLLRYLGVGYRWITRLLALLCYAMLLLPGFLQVAYSYYFSNQVHRSIIYGDQPRNRLDLYLPMGPDGKKPVVIFVTGGAWIIGVGYRWITRLLALLCYAMLLLPGFLQVAYSYYFSNQVHRSIIYGDQPRNRLDLYLPMGPDGKKPVVIFVTGGAWIIGYKAWGSLLGLQLAERDIIMACLDYRNFPQGTISDMIKDVSQGISFVCNNIAAVGGDPDRIYLVGQSAGAHISACALLEQAIRESQGESCSWSVSQIKTYFSLSGGFNLVNLVDHFNNRGLYRSIFLSIMEGESSLKKYSPELRVQNKSIAKVVSLLPPFILFHGTEDKSIPSVASENFADALKNAGGHADLILYEGKTHTDMFVQDPLRGGKDELFEHLVSVIHADDEEALMRDANAPSMRRLVPEILVKLAGQISPF